MPTVIDGKQQLIDLVNAAVASGSTERVVDDLRSGLCELVSQGHVELPDDLMQCCGDHYARRLVHEDIDRGYQIIAMTWGPRQGTSLHDHGGLWCVESVWRGSIEVLNYELMEKRDALFRFERRGSIQAGIGSAGYLIPPHEYHVIRNSTDRPAVSVHIYGGRMECCNVYVDNGDGWHRQQVKPLGLDA
jgi:predicted metal-dependent enzyme (double-stranded beta helix superfamily)